MKTYHSNRVVVSNRLACPHHCDANGDPVRLVLELVIALPNGDNSRTCTRVEFFRCPIFKHEVDVIRNGRNRVTVREGTNPQYDREVPHRCLFMRPNKWQRYPLSRVNKKNHTETGK